MPSLISFSSFIWPLGLFAISMDSKAQAGFWRHGAERATATHFLKLEATQMYLTLDLMAAFVRCRYKAS